MESTDQKLSKWKLEESEWEADQGNSRDFEGWYNINYIGNI